MVTIIVKRRAERREIGDRVKKDTRGAGAGRKASQTKRGLLRDTKPRRFLRSRAGAEHSSLDTHANQNSPAVLHPPPRVEHSGTIWFACVRTWKVDCWLKKYIYYTPRYLFPGCSFAAPPGAASTLAWVFCCWPWRSSFAGVINVEETRGTLHSSSRSRAS